MTIKTMNVKVGQRVQCNGHDGGVKEICAGQLKGMVVIQLTRGQVCVSLHDLALDNPEMAVDA